MASSLGTSKRCMIHDHLGIHDEFLVRLATLMTSSNELNVHIE